MRSMHTSIGPAGIETIWWRASGWPRASPQSDLLVLKLLLLLDDIVDFFLPQSDLLVLKPPHLAQQPATFDTSIGPAGIETSWSDSSRGWGMRPQSDLLVLKLVDHGSIASVTIEPQSDLLVLKRDRTGARRGAGGGPQSDLLVLKLTWEEVAALIDGDLNRTCWY